MIVTDVEKRQAQRGLLWGLGQIIALPFMLIEFLGRLLLLTAYLAILMLVFGFPLWALLTALVV